MEYCGKVLNVIPKYLEMNEDVQSCCAAYECQICQVCCSYACCSCLGLYMTLDQTKEQRTEDENRGDRLMDILAGRGGVGVDHGPTVYM